MYPKVSQTSVDVQNGSLLDYYYEQPTADDNSFYDNQSTTSCPSPPPPGESFDILKSAALFAGIITDQSYCPETKHGKGIKRKHPEIDEDEAELVSRDLAVKKSYEKPPGYDVGGTHVDDGDVKNDTNVSKSGDSLFLSRPTEYRKTEYPTFENFGHSRKKLEYSSITEDKDNDEEYSFLTLSNAARDAPDSESAMESDSDDSSDSDTSDESWASDSYGSDSASDIDTDSDDSITRTDDEFDDDTDDEVECPDTCACNGGQSYRVIPFERDPRIKVSTPLYKKLLQYQVLKRSNRFRRNCCELYCSYLWRPRTMYKVTRDYSESNLRMDHFSWGTWKEEEPTCPDTCICKTGNSIKVQEIKRNAHFHVVSPLYRKLLQLRLLRFSNRNKYVCCDRYCSYSWKREMDTDKMMKDYWESDLRICRYKWGEWINDEEKEEAEVEEDSSSDED